MLFTLALSNHHKHNIHTHTHSHTPAHTCSFILSAQSVTAEQSDKMSPLRCFNSFHLSGNAVREANGQSGWTPQQQQQQTKDVAKKRDVKKFQCVNTKQQKTTNNNNNKQANWPRQQSGNWAAAAAAMLGAPSSQLQRQRSYPFQSQRNSWAVKLLSGKFVSRFLSCFSYCERAHDLCIKLRATNSIMWVCFEQNNNWIVHTSCTIYINETQPIITTNKRRHKLLHKTSFSRARSPTKCATEERAPRSRNNKVIFLIIY